MEEAFAKYINVGVQEVLQTMAQIDNIALKDAYVKNEETQGLGDISVIIGFSGPTVRGTFILHFNKSMALFLLDKIFMMQEEKLVEEALDAVGEVTNMIVGKIKTDVVNGGVPEFDITVPTIIVGQNFQTHIKMNDKATIFPFVVDGTDHTLNVELEVKKIS